LNHSALVVIATKCAALSSASASHDNPNNDEGRNCSSNVGTNGASLRPKLRH
jgi:hypothetical protein